MIARGSWVRTGGGAPVLVALVFRVLRARMWLRQLAREWPQRRSRRDLVVLVAAQGAAARELGSWCSVSAGGRPVSGVRFRGGSVPGMKLFPYRSNGGRVAEGRQAQLNPSRAAFEVRPGRRSDQ